jgi:hypothetical protein
MFNSKSPFISTIIIVEELHSEFRGYFLKGREFVLKEPVPREDFAITLEGTKIKDKYWVVSKQEYMRVVPESLDWDSDEIYIPLFVARLSFRPRYLKTTKIML